MEPLTVKLDLPDVDTQTDHPAPRARVTADMASRVETELSLAAKHN